VARQIGFTVAGPPAQITFEFLDGKDTIETGALPPTLPGATPLPEACDWTPALLADPSPAAAVPQKTVLITRVLDANGTQLVGPLVNWDHPVRPTLESDNAGQLFAVGPSPNGGVALAGTPTWDLGPFGRGFPQVVCGGEEPGDLALHTFVSNSGEPYVTSHPVSATVHALVQDPPGAPAIAIPTPEATSAGFPKALALNAGACDAFVVVTSCEEFEQQSKLQLAVACNPAAQTPGDCGPFGVPPLVRPGPEDFARFNLDAGSRVAPEQWVVIVAFLDHKGAVHFL